MDNIVWGTVNVASLVCIGWNCLGLICWHLCWLYGCSVAQTAVFGNVNCPLFFSPKVITLFIPFLTPFPLIFPFSFALGSDNTGKKNWGKKEKKIKWMESHLIPVMPTLCGISPASMVVFLACLIFCSGSIPPPPPPLPVIVFSNLVEFCHMEKDNYLEHCFFPPALPPPFTFSLNTQSRFVADDVMCENSWVCVNISVSLVVCEYYACVLITQSLFQGDRNSWKSDWKFCFLIWFCLDVAGWFYAWTWWWWWWVDA